MPKDLPPYLRRLWQKAEDNPGVEVDIGRTVVCDQCYEDYTDRQDSGGVICQLLGGSAYCPKCTPALLQSLIRENEEFLLVAQCRPDQSFADFVRQYRGKQGNRISVGP